MGLDLWEARFASRGGVYYFILRNHNAIPIYEVAREVERRETARGHWVRYVLEPAGEDEDVLEVEVGSAKATRRGARGYLHVKMAKIKDLRDMPWERWGAVFKDAPDEVVNVLLANPKVPTWMKRRIREWGVWR